MNTAWFILLGFLLVGYAVLDGIDLGIGMLHLVLGKTDGERRTNLNAIGPFWAGYEVWLLVAGGSMVAAFPHLYAVSFSGFYLVLILVLWLLIGRGVGIEFRSHIADPMWRSLFDVLFCVSSFLLAVLFGAAVGNVVRGVPLDDAGNFQGSFALALNPYAILIGLLSVALLAMHGANFLALKTDGGQQARARLWASRLWYGVAALVVTASVASFFVRPVGANFARYPFLTVLPLLAFLSLLAVPFFQRRGDDGKAVYAGAFLLGSLMASAGASLYPMLLPDLNRPGEGLSVFNSAAPQNSLELAFIANVCGMVLVIGYHIVIHRVFRGTVQIRPGEHGY